MIFFLFKPHVVNAAGAITTPDVIVDHLCVSMTTRPVGMLSQNLWHEADPAEVVWPAFVITALGGGALLGPGFVMASGQVVAARRAWRMAALGDGLGEVRLNGRMLDEIAPPKLVIAAANGAEDALPRGYMLVTPTEEPSSTATLRDPATETELTAALTLSDPEVDRWGDARPRPRYSVGPTQREVTHYL